MLAAAPPETVNNKCLCRNDSPHSLFLSCCITHVLALASGVNIVLMTVLLLLQGSLGSPGLPGKDGAKGEAVSFFCSPPSPAHVILAFQCKPGSGNQSVLSETRLGDLYGHFRSSRNKRQEVNSLGTLPRMFPATVGVVRISHPQTLQGQLCSHSLSWKRGEVVAAWGLGLVAVVVDSYSCRAQQFGLSLAKRRQPVERAGGASRSK